MVVILWWCWRSSRRWWRSFDDVGDLLDDGGYPLGFLLPKASILFDYHHTWWRLFQKRVVFISLYIYVLLTGCRRWCCDVVWISHYAHIIYRIYCGDEVGQLFLFISIENNVLMTYIGLWAIGVLYFLWNCIFEKRPVIKSSDITFLALCLQCIYIFLSGI